jgi:superfamily I DNA/RNA helicase
MRRRAKGGAQVAATAATALGRALDYQFLLTLSDRLEKTTDAAQRKTLEDLRALITELQAQQRESAQAMMGQAQEVLQAVLEATDTEEALRQYADAIDETFLALLAGNIERAEQTKATAAVRRLREIYDMALDIVQEGMPPEMRLINDLLNAADKAAIRKLLEENRGLLNQEFIEALRGLEEDFRSRGNPEVADRIKSVRGQAALMV